MMLKNKIMLIGTILPLIFSSNINALNQNIKPNKLTYADKKLNQYYKEIMSKIRPSEQIKLKKAQKQWLIFRNADCSWAFHSKPLDCLIERTNNRIRELQEMYFDDAEGNYRSLEY